jgi:N-acetyltransferase
MTFTVKAIDLQPTLKGRLIEIRPLRSDDFDAAFAAASDPLIWEQHPDPDRYRREVFQSFFDGAIQSGGALAVIDRKSGRIIGTSGYRKFDGADREVEIGFTFLERAFWGGPYNGELKKLMLDHAFQFVDRVVFLATETNVRSQKALYRIGARYIGKREMLVPKGVSICLMFAIDSPAVKRGTNGEIRIRPAADNEAHEVHRIMREAFAEYRDRLTPPTGALTETVEDVQKAMAAGGALLAYIDDVAAGTARYQIAKSYLHAQRIGVLTEYRRRGVSAALMNALEHLARQAGLPEIRLAVRASLPSNLRNYENLGYRAFESSPHPRGPDWEIWFRKLC